MTTAEKPVEKLQLHELTDLALDVERRIDTLTEESLGAEALDFALKEALGTLQGDIKENATALAALVLNREADAAHLQHQAGLLTARAAGISKRAQAIQHGADRLRDYIAGSLAALGPDTQKLPGLVAVTLSKESQPKLAVIDAKELPYAFRIDVLEVPALEVPALLAQYVKSYKPDKDALAKDGVDEAPPPGTEMRTPKRRLLVC